MSINKFSLIEESTIYEKNIGDLKKGGVKKFSDYSTIEEKTESGIETVYDGYLKIKKDSNGYEYVSESDCAIGLIHFVESNEVLFRLEPVPPFQEREGGDKKYCTILSGTINNDEKPFDCLIREMVEEAGIVLNTSFDMLEYLGKFYFNKGNMAMVHMFYVPLYINDYRTVKIKGDGSRLEQMSENIVVGVQYLDDLVPSDLITALCIEKLKNKLKL